LSRSGSSSRRCLRLCCLIRRRFVNLPVSLYLVAVK
jgi:hypothetical protein